MRRTWAVWPDQEDGTVSREALRDAFMDAEALLHVAGGVLQVVYGRRRTRVPGEMETTGAVFEWLDRTDAKPQAEQPVQVVAPPREVSDDPTPDELEEALEREFDPENPDGFEPAAEEDLESVPMELR